MNLLPLISIANSASNSACGQFLVKKLGDRTTTPQLDARSAFPSKSLRSQVAVQLVGIPCQERCEVAERAEENLRTKLMERACRLTIPSRARFLLSNCRPQRMPSPTFQQRRVFLSGNGWATCVAQQRNALVVAGTCVDRLEWTARRDALPLAFCGIPFEVWNHRFSHLNDTPRGGGGGG